jgi:hypothetical protein
MQKRSNGLLLLILVCLPGVGIALWLTGKLPFLKAPTLGASDTDDTDTPAGDASATGFRHQAGPLSSAQLGAPLVHGAWITACGAPDTMKVAVKLDVRQGRAVKVDVTTDPPDPVVTGCVERAANDLRWDVSPKTDHVTVRY